MNDTFLKQASTKFLRLALLVLGIIVLALCVVVLGAVHREWNGELPDATYARYPLLALLTLSALLFYAVLYQSMKLLKYIDKSRVFSTLTVTSLKHIKNYALIMSFVHVLILPFMYLLAQSDDAPGLIIVGMLFAAVPFVVAVFAALMQQLLQNAIDIKSENDLTV